MSQQKAIAKISRTDILDKAPDTMPMPKHPKRLDLAINCIDGQQMKVNPGPAGNRDSQGRMRTRGGSGATGNVSKIGIETTLLSIGCLEVSRTIGEMSTKQMIHVAMDKGELAMNHHGIGMRRMVRCPRINVILSEHVNGEKSLKATLETQISMGTEA